MVLQNKLEFKFKSYKIIPLVLLPIFLLIGPAIADLLIILSVLFFLYISAKQKKYIWIKDKIFVLLMLIWLGILLNLFFSANLENSLIRALSFVRFPLFVISVKYFYLDDKKNIKILLSYWLVILFCTALDTYLQFFTGKNILGYNSWYTGHIYRLSSFLKDEYKIGGYILPFAAILIGYFFNIKKLFISFILIIFFFSVLFFTGERANFYIFIIFIFLFLIFNNLNFKKSVIFIILLILYSLVLFNIHPNQKNRAFGILKNISEINSTDKINLKKEHNLESKVFNNYFFKTHYASHYLTAYKMFIDNKWFGVGLKNFRIKCSDIKYSHNLIHNKKRCSTHPHNFVLEILSELGIVGSIPIFFFIIYVIINSYKTQKVINSNLFLSLFLIIIVSYFPLLPRGSFFTNWNAIIFWLIVGLWSVYTKKKI